MGNVFKWIFMLLFWQFTIACGNSVEVQQVEINLERNLASNVTFSQALTAVTPEQDFQSRCSAPGVLVCQGFDLNSAADLPRSSTTNVTKLEPNGLNSYDKAIIDHNIKSSGTGALRFQIDGNTGADHSGAFRQVMGQSFGPGKTFYAQFRLRMDDVMAYSDWDNMAGGASPKIVLFHYHQNTCGSLEYTTVINSWYSNIATTYSNCGTSGSDNAVLNSSGKKLMQQGDYNCVYGSDYLNDPNCFKYVANKWMTMYYKVTIGDWSINNSTLEAWVSVDGGPYKQWRKQNNYRFSNNTGNANAGFDTVYLTTYITRKNSLLSHPTAYTWYDELIVSTKPIAAPGHLSVVATPTPVVTATPTPVVTATPTPVATTAPVATATPRPTSTPAPVSVGTTVLVNFGATNTANSFGFRDWTTVIKDTYTGYSTLGPSGLTITAGSNGSYNYQGVSGTQRSFLSGQSIHMVWYNSSASEVNFTPKVSFNDPDRVASVTAGTWHNMSAVRIPALSSARSIFTFSSTTAGNYSLVNINVNFSNNKIVIADRIELVSSGTIAPTPMATATPRPTVAPTAAPTSTPRPTATPTPTVTNPTPTPLASGNHVLDQVTRGMAAGEFKEFAVPTFGAWMGSYDYAWMTKIYYDPVRNNIFMGGKRADSQTAGPGGAMSMLKYTGATNTWAKVYDSGSDGYVLGAELGHIYECLTVDWVTGFAIFKPFRSTNLAIFNENKEWLKYNDAPASVGGWSAPAAPTAFHPNLFGNGKHGFIVGGTSGITAYNPETDQVTKLVGGYDSDGYTGAIDYNPHQDAVFVTKATGSTEIYKVSRAAAGAVRVADMPADGIATPQSNTPRGRLLSTPAGNQIIMDGNSSRIWRLQTSSWQLLSQTNPAFNANKKWFPVYLAGKGAYLFLVFADTNTPNIPKAYLWKPPVGF